MRQLQFKTGGSVKDVDTSKRTVVFFASRFGNEDSDGDVMVKGAYERSIAEWGPGGKDRIWHLADHDFTKRLAKPKALRETDEGLLIESEIPDTTLGRDMLALYDAVGQSMEHSVGFEELRRAEDDSRKIIDVKLWEVSTVTWGANDMARAVELKTLSTEPAADVETLCKKQISTLHALLKECVSDASRERLEAQLRVFDAQLSALSAAKSQKAEALEQHEGDRAKEAAQEAQDVLQAINLRTIQRKLQEATRHVGST
jgi:HK97 family phage prohead protease